MSEYHIEITRRAKEDIIDTGDYITYTLLEPQTAQNFVKGLRKAISSLHNFPQRYPLVDDPILRLQNIRCMPYKNYFVFYEIVERFFVVQILRVGYNRRNWKEILKV